MKEIFTDHTQKKNISEHFTEQYMSKLWNITYKRKIAMLRTFSSSMRNLSNLVTMLGKIHQFISDLLFLYHLQRKIINIHSTCSCLLVSFYIFDDVSLFFAFKTRHKDDSLIKAWTVKNGLVTWITRPIPKSPYIISLKGIYIHSNPPINN